MWKQSNLKATLNFLQKNSKLKLCDVKRKPVSNNLLEEKDLLTSVEYFL